MSQTVFRPITPEILIASKPFTRFGFLPWGGRSTFIFLPSNELFIVVSTPLDERTRTSLHEFAGTEWESKVAYLLAPDDEHTLYTKEWKKAFPSAQVIASKTTNLPDIDIHNLSTIKIQLFGQLVTHELAVLHVPSKTLIEADLLFNLPAKEQYSKGKAGWFGSLIAKGIHVDGWAHKFIVSGGAGKGPAAIQTGKDASVVASWDFTRIIPCHGEVIEKDGKTAWNKAYGALQAASNEKKTA
ncbi:hypothetical protein BDY24DRAFT_372829 [Mrakia frigida]|uniref:uncharacterized protein n=1 Tax=Mrakia frigida TaxID=29902 RepID=UPI003FCC0289